METSKHKIIKIASTLFLLYGFRSVTMDHIAQEGHISKKTIYLCFESKELLISAVLHELEQNIKTQINNVLFESDNPVKAFSDISYCIFYQQFKQSSPAFSTLKKYYPKQYCLFYNMTWKLFSDKAGKQLKKGISEGLFIPQVKVTRFCYILIHILLIMPNETETAFQKNFVPNMLIEKTIYYALRSIATPSGIATLEKIESNQFKKI